jgi:DNA helicase II / ATP-dependent DNA helicase PcrA
MQVPTTPVISWSPQQLAFLTWAKSGSGSCVLEAVAGAGKSTTLVEAARLIPGQVALRAYNKSAGEELKAKLAKAGLDWKKAQAGTVHSFGFKAYSKQRPNVKVDGNKVRTLVDVMVPTGQAPGTVAHPLAVYGPDIINLVSLAKQLALGIVQPANNDQVWYDMAEHFDVFDEEGGSAPKAEVIAMAQQVLARSTADLDTIDFDDMIYMPLYHRCRFWQFDVIMVDEAQDTNAARRALVRAMLKKGGRVIAVGDRHQAIYGFTGADADSLDLITRDFNCIQMPLTVTYRCPKAVVAFSQQWVSHIQAAETAPEGLVSQSTMEAFLARKDLTGEAAVLSRVTKPLVALAFTLIRKRIPCRIEGRDVANKLTKMIQRWNVKTLDALEGKLEVYLAKETTKLLAKKQETKLAEVEDVVETIRVIIDQCRAEGKLTIADAVAYVESMFSDNVKDMLVLSTIHKAKGREWRRVFWLDRAGTCPNKWARQAWQQGQEVNLMYVAATRAKEELVELEPAAKNQHQGA